MDICKDKYDCNSLESLLRRAFGDAVRLTPTNRYDTKKEQLYDVVIPDHSGRSAGGHIPYAQIGCCGAIKGEVRGLKTDRWLRKELLRHAQIFNDIQRISDKAEKFGARVINVFYQCNEASYLNTAVPKAVPQKTGLYIQTEIVKGRVSAWTHRDRCLSKTHTFNRTDLKQTQYLVLCAIRALFPTNEKAERSLWGEDSRTILGNGKEIDIYSTNFLRSRGGIQVEYNGHQSHKDPEKIASQEEKSTLAPGLFLSIPKLKSMCANKALDAVLLSLEEAVHEHKQEFLLLMTGRSNKNIIADIENAYARGIGRKALIWRKRAIERAEELNRTIITKPLPVLAASPIQWQCKCGAFPLPTTLKQFCESDAKGCNACRPLRQSSANAAQRSETLSEFLKEQAWALPEAVVSQIENAEHITCPNCQSPTFKNKRLGELLKTFEADRGFLCRSCVGTGEKIFNNVGLRSQSRKTVNFIEDMREHFTETSQSLADVISIIDNKIYITLRCRALHENTKTLRQWKAILVQKKRPGREVCPTCLPLRGKQRAPDEIAAYVKQSHPSGSIIRKTDNKNQHVATCGLKTMIGENQLAHPTFVISTRKRNETEKLNDISYCLICAELDGRPQTRNAKTKEQMLTMMQQRLLVVSDVTGIFVNHNKLTCIEHDKKFEFKLEFQEQTLRIAPATASNITGKKRVGMFLEIMKATPFNTFEEIRKTFLQKHALNDLLSKNLTSSQARQE